MRTAFLSTARFSFLSHSPAFFPTICFCRSLPLLLSWNIAFQSSRSFWCFPRFVAFSVRRHFHSCVEMDLIAAFDFNRCIFACVQCFSFLISCHLFRSMIFLFARLCWIANQRTASNDQTFYLSRRLTLYGFSTDTIDHRRTRADHRRDRGWERWWLGKEGFRM